MGYVRQGEIQRLGPNTIIRPNRGQLEREDSDAPPAGPRQRRMVVTGAGGMLGQRVVDVGRVHGWDVVAAPRAEIDVTNLDLTTRTLEALSPTVHSRLGMTRTSGISCRSWARPRRRR